MAMTIEARDIDEILSRQRLQDLNAAYCRGVDRTDEALLRSIFHEDATVDAGVFNGNAMEFARVITEGLRQNSLRTFHSVSNQWFEIDGDSAVGETYVIGLNTTVESGSQQDSVSGGRYLDRFERRDGVWKFVQRTYVMDWNINQPSTAVMDEGMFAAMVKGGRKPDDPIYGLWPRHGGE